MAKKAIESGTRGSKNNVLKRPIDLTVSNEVPTIDKCPMDKSPSPAISSTTKRIHFFTKINKILFLSLQSLITEWEQKIKNLKKKDSELFLLTMLCIMFALSFLIVSPSRFLKQFIKSILAIHLFIDFFTE